MSAAGGAAAGRTALGDGSCFCRRASGLSEVQRADGIAQRQARQQRRPGVLGLFALSGVPRHTAILGALASQAILLSFCFSANLLP